MYALYLFHPRKKKEMGCFMENSQNKVIYLLQIPIVDGGSTPGED